MADTTLTWLGHAAFRIDTATGKRIYIDPFLNGNPKCPAGEQEPERADIVAVTHGHGDHVGDTVAIAQKHGSTVVAQVELAGWLGKQGVDEGLLVASNKGGTVEVAGIGVTMTSADHSAGDWNPDGGVPLYLGEPAGFVLTMENGFRIYHAGDTAVFGDMRLIGELYRPHIALLPIGDFYTMDPVQGAYAIRLLGVKTVVPMHYGTFPVLTGTPQRLRELTKDVADLQIIDLKPGETLTGRLKRLVAV